MRSRLILTLIAIIVVIAIGLAGSYPGKTAGAPKAADDFQLIKVADGVCAAIARPGGLASGNAGFVIGDEGVLIFDTFFTPTAIEELVAEIQTLTKLPIKYAVNSHYHLDHTGGDVFAYVPDANVVFTGDLGWSQTLPNLVDATVNDR